MIILDMIPKGLENAISTAELSRAMGTDERTVRATIANFRTKGVIICSNSDKSIGPTGYFYPVNREELEVFVRVEQARIRSHRAAIAPAVKKLKKSL